MNKLVVSLVTLLLASGMIVPGQAQDVASVEPTAVVIAPALTPLARTIKQGLSEVYYAAARGTEAYKRLLLSQLIKAHFIKLFPALKVEQLIS